MTLPEIDHVSFLVEHAQTFFAGERATGYKNMCACGVTNSCSDGQKCNCYNSGSGWREDSGLLTYKSTLPVTQIRRGDLDHSSEEGYHTLGKVKCHGQA